MIFLLSLYSDAVIERHMPMNAASRYWLDALHDCNLNRSVALPYDRYRLSNERRTGRLTSMSFNFGQDLSQKFVAYASANNMLLEHLTLTCYFAFLFKLINAEKDLCIGMHLDHRYTDECRSIIGLFQNTIALRCQLDSHWSVRRLIKSVQEMMTSSMEYSYFPIQRALEQHPTATDLAFCDALFDFRSHGNDDSETMIGDSRFHAKCLADQLFYYDRINQSDFAFIFQHARNTNELSCTIAASLDVFDTKTIEKISHRFHSMLHELFSTVDVEMKQTISTLSWILPDENSLMQSMHNTEVSFVSTSCIHHDFVDQVMKNPQKLAVELDEQSLTYSELLHYVQVLSLNLLSDQTVLPGDVICQCVERSISMASRSKI